MKKLLIGLGIVVILIGGGAVFVLSNLNSLVKTAIETYGSEAVGSQVSVGSVDINLTEGSAAIYDFSIANPPGFSDQMMLSFAEVSVDIDVSTVNSEMIGIDSIVAREPFVLYERANGTTNIDTVNARFASDEVDEPVDNTSADSELQLYIVSILVESIQAEVAGEGLPDLTFDLGDIYLQELQGSPDEIASQIIAPLMTQVSSSAASALLTATTELLTDGLEGATESLENLGGTLEEGLEEGLNDVGDALEEGLGNLFGN